MKGFLRLVSGMARAIYFQGVKFEDEVKPKEGSAQPKNQPAPQAQMGSKPRMRR
jgi:hypothetical protein